MFSLWSSELLAAAIIALYLWDCMKRVAPEVRLVESIFGRLRPLPAAFKLRKGLFTFVNPLTPFAPLYKGTILSSADQRADEEASNLNALYSIQPVVSLQFFWVICLAPFALIMGRELWFLLAFLVAVITHAIIAGWLFFHASAIGMSKRRMSAIIFEATICLPYSVNILRAVSLEAGATQNIAEVFRNMPISDQEALASSMADYLRELPEDGENIDREALQHALLHVEDVLNDR